MAYSFMTAISDGTLKSMPITFNYMKVEDIVVHHNLDRLTSGIDYTISNNVITFKNVIPALGRIAVDRMSQRDSLRVNFVEGATFSRENMDDVLTQMLYLTQEAMEGSVDRISPTGVLDLAGNRIINLGNPIDLHDAVPLHLVVDAEKSVYASEAKCKQYRDEALGYKDSAFSSADRAYASERNAKASETAAATSANSVKGLEVKAQASADAALVSQNAAKVSETNAKTSETNSKASETSALSSKNSAASSATTATNAMNSAKTSETNAKSSETKSKTSETNAKTSETNAKASEINAANSASSILGAVEQSAKSAAAAKVSETNAKASENKTEAMVDKVEDALVAVEEYDDRLIAVENKKYTAKDVGAVTEIRLRSIPDGQQSLVLLHKIQGAAQVFEYFYGEIVVTRPNGLYEPFSFTIQSHKSYNETRAITRGFSNIRVGSSYSDKFKIVECMYEGEKWLALTTNPSSAQAGFAVARGLWNRQPIAIMYRHNDGTIYNQEVCDSIKEIGILPSLITTANLPTPNDIGAVASSNVVGSIKNGALFERILTPDGWDCTLYADGTIIGNKDYGEKAVTLGGTITTIHTSAVHAFKFITRPTFSCSVYKWSRSSNYHCTSLLSSGANDLLTYTPTVLLFYGGSSASGSGSAGITMSFVGRVNVDSPFRSLSNDPSTLEEPEVEDNIPNTLEEPPILDMPQVLPYDPEI